jgi:hypothetical protein
MSREKEPVRCYLRRIRIHFNGRRFHVNEQEEEWWMGCTGRRGRSEFDSRPTQNFNAAKIYPHDNSAENEVHL